MKKSILTSIFTLALMAFSGQCHAQYYKTAIGARLGYPTSASIKHFIGSSSNAVELYVGTRGWSGYRWFNVSGAYQIHNDFPDVNGLQYYFGAGASAFFWNFNNNILYDGYSTTTIGLQGYAGLDYTFDGVPLSLTLDWVPTIFINGFGSGFGGGYGTFGVRYILSSN